MAIDAQAYGKARAAYGNGINTRMGTRDRQIASWPQSPNACFWHDDFLGDTLDTFFWNVNKTSSATSNFAAYSAGSAVQGGVIAANTSATGNEGVLMYGGLENWSGDKGCGMAIKVAFDVVTTLDFFMGFVDPLTSYSSTPNPVTDIDIPTLANGAVTCAAFCLDTGQTLTTVGHVLSSNSTYTATTKSMVQAATPATAFTPTAAKYYTYIIQTLGGTGAAGGDNVLFAIRDENDALIRTATINILYEGATLVHPLIWVQTLTTAAKLPSIDYWDVWGDR